MLVAGAIAYQCANEFFQEVGLLLENETKFIEALGE
jgi:hypothetical protein